MGRSAFSNRAAVQIAALTLSIFAGMLSIGFTKPASAQTGSSAHKTAGHNARSPVRAEPSSEERKLELDRDRLEFEKQKFGVEAKRENEKLENERTKIYVSAVSTIVPIIAALMTLGYSIYSFHRQSSETARLQNETAKLQFEMKAAEIAFTGKTPKAVENRGKILKKIFGNRLPEDFLASFDATGYGIKEPTPEKITFLDQLLTHPGKQHLIFSLWEALFGDDWLERVKEVLDGDLGNELEKIGVEKQKPE